MLSSLCVLALTLGLAADDKTSPPRKPHPLAPSLPELTEEEEAKLDAIIDAFIKYDTRQLRGAEGLKALKEFEALGPEAIPALIRGLNRAAAIEHSCPALVIAKKLQRMLLASKDVELLEFARQEIGGGVEASRHRATMAQLRLSLNARKNELARQGITDSSPRSQSTAQLIEASRKEKGAKLRPILTELSGRKGDEPLRAFVGVAESGDDKQMQQLARTLIQQRLTTETPEQLRKRAADASAEVRLAAVTAIVSRGLAMGDVLIERLTDKEARVKEAAHKGLVKLSRGVDYGPTSDESYEVEKAMRKWKEWWDSRSPRR